MLSSFWRRKNGRLVQRLNAAVEATERMSEVYNAPKPPRVIIDTSYVERRSRQPTIARQHGEDPYAAEAAPPMTGMPAHAGFQEPEPGFDAADLADWHRSAAPDQSQALPEHDNAFAPATADAWDGDVSLLKEAVEQLELAEQREADALQELEIMRRKAAELEAAVDTEREARRSAEAVTARSQTTATAADVLTTPLASSAALSANAIADTEARARLEAKLMLEQAARRESEAQRDAARQQLNDLKADIEALREAAKEADKEQQKAIPNDAWSESEAHEEIAALRSRNEELAAEAARAREGLSRAESEARTARKTTEAVRKEAADLRQTVTKTSELEKELADAKTREADARAETGNLQTRIEALEAQIAGIHSDHAAKTANALKDAEQAAAEVAALRLAADQAAERRACADDETSKRHVVLLKDVETLRGHIAGLEAAGTKEREAAQRALDEANKKIAALHTAARERDERDDRTVQENRDSEKRAVEALAEVEILREQIATMNETLEAERQAAANAAAEALTQIESLRLAAQEIAADSTQTVTEESAKAETLRSELDALRKQVHEMETALVAAQAACLNAQFERDNARQQASDAEARIAALANRVPSHSSMPSVATNEPPVFKSASAANDLATPAANNRSRDVEHAKSPASALVEATEGAAAQTIQLDTVAAAHDTAPRDEPVASQQIAVIPPPLPQALTWPAVDSKPADIPVTGDFTVYATGPAGSAVEADDSQQRGREKRVASRMAITLWTEAWGQPLSCFLVDKSSRGAKIEMKPDRIFGGTNRIAIGDRLTLTFYYPQERTSVFCDVIWMEGNFLGVRYYGQFHTEFNKARPNQRRRFGAAE